MSTSKQRFHAVPGSLREAPAGSHRIRSAAATTPAEVTVVLHRRSSASLWDGQTALARMDRAAFAASRGADRRDVARLEEFAHTHGLSITSIDLAARAVGLAGTVGQMNQAFHVDLGEYTYQGTTYRGREGEIHVPAGLAPMIQAVLGLDDRRQARPHFRMAQANGATPDALEISYPPQQVARRYDFPTDADGSGQTVALIELGGGYYVHDLKRYFTNQKLRTPRITAVSVDGARNTPGGKDDGKVALDIEMVGAIAQGATMAVYFAPNTTRGFYNAIAAALHDQLRRPTVISISWGNPESSWTAQAMDSYDALFADAAALGVTVFCAAGDNGATAGLPSGLHVDFPASSPHVVACGGTKLTASDETVWNELAVGHGATGGGVSRHFALPAYQQNAQVPLNPLNKPGRGVPDVAGDADPLTGYEVRVDGQDAVAAGTSAVAPLWAALTAIANQKLGKPIGAPHDTLYDLANGNGAFRDIVTGGIDGYDARQGWDACTGLGTPDGMKIIQAFATA